MVLFTFLKCRVAPFETQQATHLVVRRQSPVELIYGIKVIQQLNILGYLEHNMKTLYLVRHAKSSWNNAHMSDHDRPLNERGERDAPRMGKRLGERNPQPEIIICSSAVRAETTATILAEAIGYPLSNLKIDERLYGAEPNNVISIIQELDDAIECAMFVGHNPTFTDLVNTLGRCEIENMPTCSMAVLAFPIETWSEISQVRGELLDFDYPKKDLS